MEINFEKNNGLVPVIVQDATSQQVLMLGYMNSEALQQTIASEKVTFFSRSKNRLWTKGETSGNFLLVEKIQVDCDQDTILIHATALGATCHTGTTSCFGEPSTKGFLYQLEKKIHQRIADNDLSSYTNQLFRRGINKVAQKVGEEAVELVIEAKDQNEALFLGEAADLIYHYLILLKAKGVSLEDVEKVLLARDK